MDLSHWNLLKTFTAHQAASLISGIDPELTSISEEQEAKIRVIERQIIECALFTESWAAGFNAKDEEACDGIDDYLYGMFLEDDETIPSVQLNTALHCCVRKKIMFVPLEHDLDPRTFTRKDINKWLMANKLKSEYIFIQMNKSTTNDVQQNENSTDRAHVSDKLAILNQTARKFWANVDRNDKTTYTKNQDVIDWLMKHGYSKSLADSAASIIRPEWAIYSGRPPEK